MTEISPEAPPTSIRRDFLKRLGTVIAATATGVTLAGAKIHTEEARKEKDGIKTPQGTFFPLYEAHRSGITPEAIPSNLHLFFREAQVPHLYNPEAVSPGGILRMSSAEYDSPMIANDVLTNLAEKNTEIMFGDFDVPSPSIEKTEVQQIVTGITAALTAGGIEMYEKKKRNTREIKEKKVTRRLLLQGSAAVAGLVAAGNLAPQLATPALVENPLVGKIVTRLAGLANNFHPEAALVFFRNVVWAAKMLEAGAEYKKKTGNDPRIAYNVGAAHAGVEEFLQAGPQVCHAIILAFPKQFLQQVIDMNDGSIDSLCSSRVLQVPNDLFQNGILHDERLNDTTERLITDTQLATQLQEKLNINPPPQPITIGDKAYG